MLDHRGAPVAVRQRNLTILVLILLAATAFRAIRIDNFPTPVGASPPGLAHDEVAHWLINQSILAGNHAIYFTDAYGHEALYHYIQAVTGALVGDHAFALRLPSIYFGLLLVAVSHALGSRMFGKRIGLWSAAFLAVLLWPVFYSRLALRAISLPFFSGMAAWLWWMAFSSNRYGEKGRGVDDSVANWQQRLFSAVDSPGGVLLFAGLFAGLSLHTYMAARAVPVFFVLYTVYLAIFQRPVLRRNWRGVVLFWLSFIIVSAPLAIYLWQNPGAEFRISEVDAPLRALRAGDLRPVLENALRIGGMFGISGDPLWRQNIAGRPVFDPLLAILFYAGVAIALWRWRDERYAFILLWLLTSATPSLVTVDAPSSIRIINLLPVLMLFPLLVVHRAPHLSTRWDKLSTILTTRTVELVLAGLLILAAAGTLIGVCRVWPANDEVRFVWQAALTEAAAYLDDSLERGPVAVGGWTPETMDPPTMQLTLRRDDLSLRYFNPTEGMVIPVAPAGERVRIVTPAILPLAPALEEIVSAREDAGDFKLYVVLGGWAPDPEQVVGVEFGEQLLFLGYNLAEPCVVGDACRLITFWRVIVPADGPRRLFLYAMEGDEVVEQDDRLGAPSEFWLTGDTIVQILTLERLTPQLRLGVYDPLLEQRLLTTDGADSIAIDLP